MVHKTKWANVRIDRKGSKKWLEREYSTLSSSSKNGRSILVYDDGKYGWRVWKGRTVGSGGVYFSFSSKAKALGFAKNLMGKK
jgi:hypothetical protein